MTTNNATSARQREFAAKSLRKLELQDELNQLTKDLEAMQEPLLEYFADAGQSTVRVDGVTLYIESRLWANAKPGESENACRALAEHGFAQFVHPTFNVQTLSAEARDMERKGETFPAAVLEYLDVKPKVQIRARRS